MIAKDYHIHSEFSRRFQSKFRELIEHCIQLGLKEIAITDHAEYGIQNLPESFILPFPKYVETIQEYQENIANKSKS